MFIFLAGVSLDNACAGRALTSTEKNDVLMSREFMILQE